MVATPSSKIGSIGVYIMHVDFSGNLEQAGIQITYIEAPKGGMKTAGSAYRKLDRKTADYLQAFVDASYEDFVALVVENRGMDDAAVRETEARVFRSEEALALGLIDEVKTPSEAVSSFVAELANDEPNEEEDEEMKTQAQGGSEATSGQGNQGGEQSQGGAPAPAAAAAPTAADIQAAIREDRERMAAIKALPEAAKLPKLADTLATAGYTVEEATTALKAAVADLPTEAPQGGEGQGQGGSSNVDNENHLERAMAGTKQPEVGAGQGGEGGQGGGEQKSDAEVANAILADHALATGRSYEPAK
jgi:hypothetical protein